MAKSPLAQNLRRQVAAEAARLMIDLSIDDYLMAKKKAAERLGLKDHAALPTNQEIESALLENHRLFLGAESEATLMQLRSVALDVMHSLAPFKPRLVGAVLSGAITSVTAVEIHLFSDDVETVAMELMDQRVDYRLTERRVRLRTDVYQAMPVFGFERNDVDIEVYVFKLNGERQSPLSPIDGKPMVRMAAKGVNELINTNQSASVIDAFFG